MLRSLITLACIGLGAGSLLVVSNELTKERIDANRFAQTRQLMAQMLGEDLPKEVDLETLHRCQFSRQTVQGYAGSIDLLGLWRVNQVSLRVTRHLETPGIGTFIDHTRNPWMPSQDAKSQSQWANLDTVSGATSTTNAIKRAAQSVFKDMSEQSCG